jgi:hypothetical protein
MPPMVLLLGFISIYRRRVRRKELKIHKIKPIKAKSGTAETRNSRHLTKNEKEKEK